MKPESSENRAPAGLGVDELTAIDEFKFENRMPNRDPEAGPAQAGRGKKNQKRSP